MALKNRLGTGVFAFQGSEIKIQTSLSKLEALSKAVGKDAMLFIEDCMLSARADALTDMFYHLQYGSEYPRDDIHAAFFGRVEDFLTPEWQDAFGSCMADALGFDKQALIAPVEATAELKKSIKD